MALLALPAYACYDPSDPYAVEVDTGSAGITVDVEAVSDLVQQAQGVYVDVTDFEGLVYTAHGDGRLWCLVTVESVRLQVPLVEGEQEPQPLVETDDVDWTSAFATELAWLEDNGLLGGDVNLLDIDSISSIADAGTAGHNEKIRWHNGSWVQGITPDMGISGIFAARDGTGGCGGPGVYASGSVTTTETTVTQTGMTTTAEAPTGAVPFVLAICFAVILLGKSRIDKVQRGL